MSGCLSGWQLGGAAGPIDPWQAQDLDWQAAVAPKLLTLQPLLAAELSGLGLVGFIHPVAIAIPVDACGGEIAHPLQWQLLQLLSKTRQHWIRSLFAGWDGADQMGDGGECFVAWHDPVGTVKGQIIAAGFWAAARADHPCSKRFGQIGEMASAESSAKNAQRGIRSGVERNG